MRIDLPITKEVAATLRAGDVLELYGDLYTARDAAHQRMAAAIDAGEPLPIDLKDQTLCYCGPTPAKPGRPVGSVGPTTSVRMDPYMERMLRQGMTACIGKGDRAGYVTDLLREYGAVYLLGIGGASVVGALTVTEVQEIAYPDLGTESIKRYHVEGLPVIVGIDAAGRSIFEENIARYRRG